MPSEPKTVSEYDKVGDFYNDFNRKRIADEKSVHNQTWSEILRMLGDIEDTRICDLACGEGFLARILAERGGIVTGIDLSKNLLGHAERQSEGHRIKYFRDDAQTLNTVSDDSFDAVVCSMALMDIQDLSGTFATVKRVLRSNGVFIFSILHPCFETPFDAENPPIMEDDEGNFSEVEVRDLT